MVKSQCNSRDNDCIISKQLCIHIQGVFIALGLSGVIPAMHFVIIHGFWEGVYNAALGWLVLMAILYIVGAVIYAVRIPERIWPGKFDIWVSGQFALFISSSPNKSFLFFFFSVSKSSDLPPVCHRSCLHSLSRHHTSSSEQALQWRLFDKWLKPPQINIWLHAM